MSRIWTTMYGGVDVEIVAEHGDEFDELLDSVNSPIPFGDCAYSYSDAYKKVDPIAYGMSLLDFVSCKEESLNES